jgi:hypothetical protein
VIKTYCKGLLRKVSLKISFCEKNLNSEERHPLGKIPFKKKLAKIFESKPTNSKGLILAFTVFFGWGSYP